MISIERNIRVLMVRESLEDLPTHPTPSGCEIRWFPPRTPELWTQVQASADHHNHISDELFSRVFGQNDSLLAQRQAFLFCGNTPAGAATAWFDDNFYGQYYGRVHWVAITPPFQRKGLGKVLLSAVCDRLRELGHDRVYLTTSTVRIAAIKLYSHFGFKPLIRSAHEAAIWQMLEQKVAAAPPD